MKISVVSFSNVLIENPLFRIDAEYFRAEYFEADKQLGKHSIKHLEEISKSIVNFGAYSLCNYIEFLEQGVPF